MKELTPEVEVRIREIVREEMAAHEEEMAAQQPDIARAAVKAIKELQRQANRTPLDIGDGLLAGSIISSSVKSSQY